MYIHYRWFNAFSLSLSFQGFLLICKQKFLFTLENLSRWISPWSMITTLPKLSLLVWMSSSIVPSNDSTDKQIERSIFCCLFVLSSACSIEMVNKILLLLLQPNLWRMIRNHSKGTPSSPSTLPSEDTIINLPDLSEFGDEEKQHILNVLVRDENLRLQHLSRFMYVALGRVRVRTTRFCSLGNWGKKSPNSNKNQPRDRTRSVLDVKHRSGTFSTPAMPVPNVRPKSVVNADWCTTSTIMVGCVNCVASRCKIMSEKKKKEKKGIFRRRESNPGLLRERQKS